MVYGSAVFNPRAIAAAMSWAERSLRNTRIDCKVVDAVGQRSLADGARMEDEAIRLYVKRALGGEREALGQLFGEFRADVLKFCTRLVGPIEAEDATSEVFQRAQHRLESYDAAQPFRRWLLAIASNHCIDRLRRRSLEKRLFDGAGVDGSTVDDFADDRSSALDGIVQAERQACVQAALDELPDHYRVPLVLRYFADLDYDAIATELDVTRAQVATALFRGKRRLRAMLRGEQEDGS